MISADVASLRLTPLLIIIIAMCSALLFSFSLAGISKILCASEVASATRT